MYCSKCGTKNSEDSMFCEGCGAKLKKEQINQVDQVSVVPEKKKPTGIIIGLVIVLVALGAYFGKDYLLKSNSLTSWGNSYYLYLKDNIDSDSLDEIGLSSDITNTKVDFIEVDNVDDPVMVITYEKEDSGYSNIYYIDEEVKLASSSKGDVELLYEIESEKYNYYLHTEDDEKDSYTLTENIITNKDESISYDKSSDVTTVVYDNEELSLSKFDEEFVKIETNNSYDLDLTLTDEEIKEVFKTSGNNYQTREEIATDEVKTSITTKREEIETTEEKIKSVSTAITGDEFKEYMEKNNLEIQYDYNDTSSTYNEEGRMIMAMTSDYSDDDGMGFIYFTAETDDTVKALFKEFCDSYSSSGGSNYNVKVVASANTDEDTTADVSTAIMTYDYDGGSGYFICYRIKNTIIIGVASTNNTTEMNKIMTEMGYGYFSS